ncbi:MAG: SCO6880 family protein, partial [Solirubrobacteraceae bacterium]
MEAEVDRPVRTYGNWRRPRSAGLGQLGSLGTMVLLVGMIAAILTSAVFGAVPALMVFAVVGGFLSTLMLRDHHGFTGVQNFALRGGGWRTRRRGANLYRSGP